MATIKAFRGLTLRQSDWISLLRNGSLFCHQTVQRHIKWRNLTANVRCKVKNYTCVDFVLSFFVHFFRAISIRFLRNLHQNIARAGLLVTSQIMSPPQVTVTITNATWVLRTVCSNSLFNRQKRHFSQLFSHISRIVNNVPVYKIAREVNPIKKWRHESILQPKLLLLLASLLSVSLLVLELAKMAFSCCLTAIKSLFTTHLHFYLENAWKMWTALLIYEDHLYNQEVVWNFTWQEKKSCLLKPSMVEIWKVNSDKELRNVSSEGVYSYSRNVFLSYILLH